MAIAYVHMTPISRSKGGDAVRKAAYCSCSSLRNAKDEEINYTRKQGLIYSEIITPGQATPDRGEFWRKVELSEKKSNACVAREFQFSLPNELSKEAQIELARLTTYFFIKEYDLYGADVNIHNPDKKRKINADENKENPHIHLIIPNRDKKGKNLRVLNNNPKELKKIRLTWERLCNSMLEKYGIDSRIDVRSYKEQIKELEEDIQRDLEELHLEKDRIAEMKNRLNILKEKYNEYIQREAEQYRGEAKENTQDYARSNTTRRRTDTASRRRTKAEENDYCQQEKKIDAVREPTKEEDADEQINITRPSM